QWVEAQAKTKTVSASAIRGPQLQRESWMESPLDLIPTTSKQELRDAINKQKEDAKKEAEKLLEPGRNARELNPYWKDGGTGMPEENPDKHKQNRSSVLLASAAGDGGLSWLRKAYDRCKQQALDEGRSLEEVAAERWGSLKKLESMIREAERHQKGGGRLESWRDTRSDDRRGEKGNYKQKDDMLNGAKDNRDGRESREKESNRQWEKSKEGDRGELQGSISERNRDRSGYKGSRNDKDEDANRLKKADKLQKTNFQRPCSGSDSDTTPRRSGRNKDRSGYKGSSSDKDQDANRPKKADQLQKTSFQRPYSGSESDSSPQRSERNRDSHSYKGSNSDKDQDANRPKKADQLQKTSFQRPYSGSESDSSPQRSERNRDSHGYKGSNSDKDQNAKTLRKAHFYSNRHHSNESRTRHSQPDGKQQEQDRNSSSSLPRWKRKTEFVANRNEEKNERKKKTEGKQSSGSKSRSNHKRSNSSSDSENNDSSKDEEQNEPTQITPARVLSEEELNELAAKILRAEIMGDDATAADLKLQLENARKARDASKSESGALAPDFSHRRRDEAGKIRGGRKRKEEEEDNVVVLSRTSKGGLVRPVVGASDDSRAAGGKRKKNVVTHDSKGERTIYFDNDDKLDLKTMVEQEKAGTAEDQNAMFARLAGRSNDRDLDVDDMFVSKAARKQNEEQAVARDRNAAIFEHKKLNASMENCHRCFSKVSKHLIIAIGTKSYLCLPHHRSLTDGHCFIVPMQHVSAATSMDEDVWQEIQLFRKSLVQMFAAKGEDMVIMETVKNLKHFPHTAIECVPLDKELGDLAPIYFKKAVQEAGPEWSDNKKLHSLSNKDVRHVIPKGFPYFSVDFGLQGGYATVIEDESRFPAYFGREIVGGMLDAEPTLWRKPHNESFEDQRKKVLQFAQKWKPYDWTQTLVAGE
ncbi:unnamed protein product, partial [Candidula unifasciata]